MNLFFAAIVLLGITGVTMAKGIDVPYEDGETKLTGYLAKTGKEGEIAPGIIVIHAWMGINDFVKTSADRLSELGYYAFAADIYGREARPQSAAEAGKTSGFYKNNRDIYRSRIKAAIDQLIKAGADPKRIAVIGYCFGGTGALEAARANFPVKGVVSFHGGLDKRTDKDESVPIGVKVLVLHGADDPHVPEEQAKAFRDEMKGRKADWQMVYYANAVHAFTEPAAGNDNSKGAAYNELAAERSWEHMKLFLNELFSDTMH